MKEKVLELIKDRPKHFTRLIQKDEEMNRWVPKNPAGPDALRNKTTHDSKYFFDKTLYEFAVYHPTQTKSIHNDSSFDLDDKNMFS